MKRLLLLLVAILSLQQLTAQTYCSVHYYDAYYSCYYGISVSRFSLTGASGAINDVASCDGSGYINNTSLSTTIYRGFTYTATIGTGYSGANDVQVWIDFNNDGTFQTTESVGGYNYGSGDRSVSITIPAGVSTGTRRLRLGVAYAYSGYSYPTIDPCASSYYYGETRDYSVVIGTAPPSATAAPTSLAFGGVTTGSSSPAQYFIVSGSYLTGATGSLTVTAPSSFQVSSSATSGWGTSYTITYSGATVPSTPVYVRLNPSSAISYSGTVTITGGGLSSSLNIPVSGTGASACSGTPAAGTTVVAPSAGTSATSFAMSLTGASVVGGLTYQWQSSPTGAGGSFSAISGASTPSYSYSGITATTFFNCIVTCSSSGGTSTSVMDTATMTFPAASCTPSTSGGCSVSGITSLRMVAVGGSLADSNACSGTGYQNRTALSCNLYKANTYNITLASSASYCQYAQFWIDFNADGTFQSSETVGGNTSSFSSSAVIPITIPATVPTGTYRFRAITTYCGYGYIYPYIDPCMAGYYYGEARDYKVTISNPPAFGYATPVSLSFGDVDTSSTSSPLTVDITGLFLVPTNGNITVAAPSRFSVSSSAGGTYTTSYTIPYFSGTAVNTVYVKFTAPSSTGTYTGTMTVSGGSMATAISVPLSANSSIRCLGTPASGTASSSPASGSASTTFALALSGTSIFTGLTFQWQFSTTGTAGSFSNISGATNATYSASGLTTTTYYQCVVRCIYSGFTSTSNAVCIPIYCSPAPTYASTACSYYSMVISAFQLNGTSGTISDAASCSGTGYEDRSALSCTLTAGSSYTATISTGTTYRGNAQVWIDFDDNGTFASTETVGGSNNYIGTGNTFSITIPTTSVTGTHKMRVVFDYQYDYHSYPTMDACMTGYNYGDARDYTVVIAPPPPAVVATPTSIAFGGVLTGTSSAAQSFSLTGSYLTPSIGTLVVTAPSNFEVSATGSSWSGSYSVSYTSGALAITTVYVRFNPAAATAYTGSVTVTGGGLTSAVNVAVTGTGAGACSGTPTAGAAAASPTTGNSATAFSLSLTGVTVASGLTYQWQSSPTGSGGSFISISGATNPVYSFTGISATTYYNCVVTCPGSASSTSTNATATFVLPSATCTPAPTYASTGCSSYQMVFNSLKINAVGGMLADSLACDGTGYRNRTTLTCTLYKAYSYTVSITTSTSYGEYTQFWVDFNSDGTFQTTESVGGNTLPINTAGVVTISIPASAPSGTYRMRGVIDYQYDYHSYPAMDPCLSGYNYGEGRDYTVTITNPPPFGSIAPSTISFGNIATSSSSAGTNVTVNGSFLTPSSGAVTVSATTNYQVFNGTSWASSYTISYTAGAMSAVTVPARFTAPGSVGTYTGTVTVTGGGLSSALTVLTTGNAANNCTGTPTPGTASVTPAGGTSTSSFTLSLTGTSIGLGLTYQWQSSSTGTGSWTNVGGATTPSVTLAAISALTYYRCVVGCSFAGTSANSNTVGVPVYCTPSPTYAAASCTSYGMYISPFNLTGASGSIADAATCLGTGYLDNGSLSCTLNAGNTYTATIGTGSSYYGNCQVWIDFNDNGTFDTVESVGGRNSYRGGANSLSLVLPYSSTVGLHRMRIVFDYTGDGHTYPTMDPCMTGYNYGEARDYSITVGPPPPLVTTTPSTIAFGGVLTSSYSATQSFAITGAYLVPATGNITLTTPTNFEVSPDGSTWYTTSYSVSYTGGALGATTAYVRFRPTATTTYTGSITVTGGGSATVNVAVSGTGAGACTGTPTPGSAVISPTTGNMATTFTLTLSGTTLASGFSYQWQSSPTGSGGSFTSITGATNASYSFTGIGATTYYNCVITCPTYAAATTSNATATFVLPAASCTPAPTSASYACSSYGMTFSSLNLTGGVGSISDALGCDGSGYRNRTSLSCTLWKGYAYNVSIGTGSTYYMYSQFWIDFNSNGTFESTESVGGNTSPYRTTGVVSITVPGSAPAGVYRMRGVTDYQYSAHIYPGMDPCMAGYYYGEARDYTIVITDPPPMAAVTPATLAFGGVLTSTTSAPQSITITGSYLLPTTGNITVTAPTGFQVSSTGASWATSYSISYTSGTISATTGYVRFAPSSTTTYTGSVTITGGGLASAVNVAVSGTGAGACAASPTAGTAAISPSTGSVGTSFTLSLSGSTVAGGITYQWQSSPTGTGGSFTAIAGATSPAYTFTGISATTYFNCVLTCSGYTATTSTNATATYVLPIVSCTPSPSYASAACSYYGMTFQSLNLTGGSGSISDAAGCTGSGYLDRTSLSCTLWKGFSYNISIGTGSSYREYAQFWIDFNNDGTFQSTESVGGNTSPFTTTGTVMVAIPAGAASGIFRLRGVIDYEYDGHSYPTMDPCMSGYNYGEARDYKVTIITPPPMAAVAPASLAFGGVLTSTHSASQTFAVSGSYLLPASGNITVTAPTGFDVSPDGSTWYSSSYSISYTGGTLATTTGYVRFSPVSAIAYSGSVTISGGGLSPASTVTVTGNGAGACSGTPTAGTTVVSPMTGSNRTVFTLSLTGTTVASGFSYQWQSCSSSTGSYTAIAGATNASYTFTGISNTTYYNCVVTCPGYSAATSVFDTARFVLPAASCTPVPSYASSACSSYGMTFQSVNLTGASGSISDAASCTGTGYLDRTSLSCTLWKGSSYVISIGTGSSYFLYTQFWIDFDGDGTFQTTESIGGNTTYFRTSGTANITIPTGISSGTFRMRGVCDYSGDGHSYPSMDPCMGGYYYGEARDYTIYITNPPPAAAATPATLSFGGVVTGTSSAPQTFVLTGDYLLPTGGNLTVTAPSGFKVSPSGTSGTWVTSYSVSYTGGTVPSTIAYVQFNPSSAISYAGSVTLSGGGLSPAVNVIVNGTGASTCTGTPTAGTASITPSVGSTSTSFTASLSGYTAAGGITFQWQSSVTGSAGSFVNIAGATSLSYNFSGITDTTYYQCVVTCPGNTPAISNSVVANFILPSACTPSPIYSGTSCSSYGMYINPFKLTGTAGAISDATACTGTGYADHTSLSTTLLRGSTYTATIGTGTSYNGNCQTWIDFNGDGTFQTTESVGGLNNYISSPRTFAIVIPSSGSTGTFRMRVVFDYTGSGHTYPSMDPCMTGYYYGEARDYTVVVVAPSTCGGTPVAGFTLPSVVTSCAPVTSTLSLPSTAGVSGLNFQWQSSSTGSSGSFVSISGATNPTYTATSSTNIYYHAVVTCASSGGTDTSTNQLITPSPAPGAILGGSTVCLAGTTTLSNTTTGGVWWSSDTSIAIINPSTGVVSGIASGSCTISYTTAGCAPSSASFTVNTSPSAISGYPGSCVGGSSPLTVTTPGGIWSSANSAIATVDPSTGDVTATGSGTTTITYSTGCGTASTLTWTTSTSPAAITGPPSVCISSSATFGNTVSGGTWSNTPTAVGTVNPSTGVFNSTTSTGATTISYTIGYCSVNMPVLVGSAVPTAISGASAVCASTSTTLSDAVSGGAWSTSDPSIATVSLLTGVVRGQSSGTATISYSTGCGTPATHTINVYGAPVNISASSSCSQQTISLMATAGSGAFTYSWSGPLGFTATGSSPVLSNAPTTASGIYSVTASQSGCNSTDAYWVAIDSTPQLSATATPAYICSGASTSLEATVASPLPGTTNYTLYAIPYAPLSMSSVSAGPTGGDNNATVSLPFSFDYYGTSYSSLNISTNGYINFGSASTATTVVSLPSLSAPRGMIAPFWHNLNAASGTIGYATIGTAPNRKFVVRFNGVGEASGTGINTGQVVLYESSNMIDVFVSQANTASTYAGVCGIQNVAGDDALTVPGQNNTNYTVNNITSGTGWRFVRPSYTYAWSPAATLSTTTDYNPTSAGLTATEIFTVQATDRYSNCATGNVVTDTVTVYPLPIAYAISPSIGCSLDTFINIAGSQAGTTYRVYNLAGALIDSPITGTGSAVHFTFTLVPGTYHVVATSPTGCTSTMTGTCIIDNSPYPYNVTGGSACTATGLTVALSGTEPGVSYQLYRDGVALDTPVIGAGSGISFGYRDTAGTYTIIGTSPGGCNTTMLGAAIIYPMPSAYNVTGGNGCTSTGITAGLSGSDTGINYQLYYNGTISGGVVAGTGGSISFGSLSAAGIYTVTAAGAGGCTTAMAGADTISTTPSIGIGTMPFVCAPASTALISYTAATGSPTTYSIVWGSAALTAGFANVTSAALGSFVAISLPTGATGSFTGTLTVSNGYCTSVGYGITVTVYDHPAASITSAGIACVGYGANIVIGGTPGATISYRIDGGSLLTATLAGGSYTITTGPVSDTVRVLLHNVYNPACAETIDSTITLIPVPMQWVGGVSGSETDWTASANWSCGFVPTLSDNVLIPATAVYQPSLLTSGSAYAHHITIQSGATITLGAGAVLQVSGNLANNGAIISDGTTLLAGTSLHHLRGSGLVSNLQLNDTLGAVIDSGALVKVLNTLTLSAGTLTTGDSLVLGSDSTATARLTPMAAGTAISGKTKVMQYIEPGYRRYRFWGHPFSNTIGLDQLQRGIDITGTGGAANGFTTTGSNAPSAYRYNILLGNSSLSYDPGWIPFTSARATAADSNLLHRYQGIRVFIRGAKGEGLGYTPYFPSAATIGQSGNLNQGTQVIRLTKGTTYQEYNLLSNPYASPVDLGTAAYRARISGNIINAVYIWDPHLGTGGQFMVMPISTVSATPYFIQQNTAFEVRAAHNGDSLVFNESDKGATADRSLLRQYAGYSSLGIYDASHHPWDMLYIKFDENATDEQDNVNDGDKLVGGDLNFYTISSDGKRQAIDVRPYNENKVIPLGVTSTVSQDFIIRADNLDLPTGATLYLHDKLLRKYVQLTAGTEYRFTIGKDANTQGNERFELAMKPADATLSAATGITLTPNPAFDQVKVSYNLATTADVTVVVTDATGAVVYTRNLGNKSAGNVTIATGNLAAGVYMVQIGSGNQKLVQRLVKE